MRISDWSSDVCSSDLIEANRDLIRSMLIDGLLAKQGLLDGAAVASALAPANLARGFGYIWLMQLVDTEAWVPSWCGSGAGRRSEEHTSEIQSLMRLSCADFCLNKKPHTRGKSRSE